jgi:drug/metabolite transporter (DMT)-like permease
VTGHLAPARPSATAPLGIALMVLAMMLLASMDATAKYLVRDYSIVQILWVRFVIFLAVAAALARRRGIRRSFASKHWKLQIVRSLVLLAEAAAFILSFSLLPLADVHAVAAAAPLIATALAVPLLREKVGPHRWTAVAIGLVGVLIIVRPGMGVMDWAAAAPLAAGFLWALYQVLVRKVGLTDSVTTTALYTAAVGLLVLSLLVPFAWQAPDLDGWLLMLLVGILGSAAHIILFKALELAPASALQPFGYMLMVWAAVMGFLVFGHIPDLWTITGAIVVVAGGLYALHRERLRVIAKS